MIPDTFVCSKTAKTFFVLRREASEWLYPSEQPYAFQSKHKDHAGLMDFVNAHVEVGQSALFSVENDEHRILRNLGSPEFPYTRASITQKLKACEKAIVRYIADEKYFKIVCTLNPKQTPSKSAGPLTDGQIDVYQLNPGRWVKVPLRSIMKVEAQ